MKINKILGDDCAKATGLSIQIFAWGGGHMGRDRQASNGGGLARDSRQNLEVSQKSQKCV